MKPLVIELFAGRFGWSRGFVAEGWRSIGFDIMHESYHGPVPDGCELALQDVLTLHGSQFKNASAIVASPPCQAYSYMAMPWDLSKREIRWQKWERESAFGNFRLNDLFDACFRIQREAIAATAKLCASCAGSCTQKWGNHMANVRDFPCPQCNGKGKITRYIPMVVENVKGAQPWVGRAAWHFGSYFLWGDVPALMPFAGKRSAQKRNPDGTEHPPGSWFAIADSKNRGARSPVNGLKVPGISWSGHGEPGYKAQGFNVEAAKRYREEQGVKGMSGLRGMSHPGGDGKRDLGGPNDPRRFNSRSDSRKAASAAIAEIPYELSNWIARCFAP